MRKFLALVAAVAVVGSLAAVAYAAVTNKYAVTASTSPTKAGSSKRPVPIAVNFNYTVDEVEGKRPSAIRKYSIRFRGLIVNNNLFPSCTQAQLQAANGKTACAKAVVGTGRVENKAGAVNNESDRSIDCKLHLTVYNTRNRRGLLLLEGGPADKGYVATQQCPLEFGTSNGVIPVNYVRRGADTALEFTVPDNLLYPAGRTVVQNSVVKVTSKITRRTKRVRGKTRGYYESQGGCRKGKRTVVVVFTPESGPSGTASTNATCRN